MIAFKILKALANGSCSGGYKDSSYFSGALYLELEVAQFKAKDTKAKLDETTEKLREVDSLLKRQRLAQRVAKFETAIEDTKLFAIQEEIKRKKIQFF